MNKNRLLTLLVLLLLVASPVSAAGGSTNGETLTCITAGANSDSFHPDISADGRYVSFTSTADNLIEGSGFSRDVYLHDREEGTTILVSECDQAQGQAARASISADGRYVAFDATYPFVTSDQNGLDVWDVYVYDRTSGERTLISTTPSGVAGNDSSFLADVSADGRYVAFVSYADDLVAGDTNKYADVFIRDLQTGDLTRVTVSSDGTQANAGTYNAAIADGRYVTFSSIADNLVEDDSNYAEDVFLHDMQTGETTLVSRGGNLPSLYPDISADGRYVAFTSMSRLAAGDANNYCDVWGELGGVQNCPDVFLYDRETEKTSLVSAISSGAAANGPSYNVTISTDGRYVSFISDAFDLVDRDMNECTDAFVYDQQLQKVSRVSVAPDGTEANGYTGLWSVPSTMNATAFTSEADNLSADDTNGEMADIFVYAWENVVYDHWAYIPMVISHKGEF